jgi:hypothetical protein
MVGLAAAPFINVLLRLLMEPRCSLSSRGKEFARAPPRIALRTYHSNELSALSCRRT